MARPRKDTNEIEAKQRLVNSFWTLLDEHTLSGITVEMLCKDAGCHRGTFYYHYDKIDDLIDKAIEDEILGDDTFPRIFFNLICRKPGERHSPKPIVITKIDHIRQLCRQGGIDRVAPSIYQATIRLWESVLDTESAPLTEATKLLIHFEVGGTLGMLLDDDADSKELCERINDLFPMKLSMMFLGEYAAMQNVDPAKILRRIRDAGNIDA